MPGTMSKADLVADLKASLLDAAAIFVAANDADFERHLSVAALDLGRKRGRTLIGSLVLVADQASYALPADFLAFKHHLWGERPIKAPQPWEDGYPGRLPVGRQVEEAGAKKLYLDPAPTAAQISVLGSDFRYFYSAGHAIDANAANTSVLPGDRALLMLRAQAEACRELAMRNMQKPMQMREAVSSQPRNGTPTYLHEVLMEEFEKAA